MLACVLFISIAYGGYIQESIKDELRKQVVLTAEVEYRKGYIEGWHDGRKPVKTDTVYYVDTVFMDSFLIEDNIGTNIFSITNDGKKITFNLN